MPWICHCGLTNVNANTYCAGCIFTNPNNSKRPNLEQIPDSYDELLQEIKDFNEFKKLGFTTEDIYLYKRRDNPMTPQEELFSQLFNHEKVLVKDMDILQLRAHRESLAKIAFEARARLTAVDDEENGRRKKSSEGNGKPTGFSRNLNTDEATTDAINTVKDRQKRLTKADKIKAGLVALYEKSGMSKSEAEKESQTQMGAGSILARFKNKTAVTEEVKTEQKPLFNPFSKKEE